MELIAIAYEGLPSEVRLESVRIETITGINDDIILQAVTEGFQVLR